MILPKPIDDIRERVPISLDRYRIERMTVDELIEEARKVQEEMNRMSLEKQAEKRSRFTVIK